MERKVLLDAIRVGIVDLFGGSERATAFRALAGEQVAASGARAHDFAGGRDHKALSHRLFGLNSFWTSHKSLP